MKLSIIIPVYNNLTLLKECIESIQKQTFTDYEVWVIDGGSDDGTKDYLKHLTFPFNYISERDVGIYDAMNKGISLSKGEWLYFIGADDQLFDEKILENVFSNDNSTFDLMSGNVEYDSSDKIIFSSGGKNQSIKKPSWSNTIWLRNSLHHQGTFYRSSIFQNYSYSLDNRILSDYELNIKLFKEGVDCKIINQTIALCGVDGISKLVNWSLYSEGMKIKLRNSSVLFYPVFFIIAISKYLVKKLFS